MKNGLTPIEARNRNTKITIWVSSALIMVIVSLIVFVMSSV